VKTYEPAFKVNDRVRIVNLIALESFRRTWKHHDPLQSEQLNHADEEATISRVGIYHGGDIIYQLAEVPGVWHEDCLSRVELTHEPRR